MIPVAIAHPVITPSAHLLGTSIRQSKTIAITMQMIIVDITNFLLIGYIYIIKLLNLHDDLIPQKYGKEDKVRLELNTDF